MLFSSTLLTFLAVLPVTVALSFVPERWLKPNRPQLEIREVLTQSIIVTLLFLIITLLIQRTGFSAIAVLVFLSILVIVSNAKYQALKEPLVFSDIAMFSQAFKHPRLYFPFLGLVPVLLGPLIITGLIYTVLSLEPAMPFTWTRIVTTLIAILILSFLLISRATKPSLSLKPETDNAKYGLLNSLCYYTLQAGTHKHKITVKKNLEGSPFFNSSLSTNPDDNLKNDIATKKKTNITVIQSESFFDARRLHPSIKKSILENFDKCTSEATMSGKLRIPAWGANTMRSEFSFLSGVPNSNLDLYQYYPYQYLYNTPLYTLASSLRELGYYCVCIHPHPASFFGRDRIFPKMGFDEFIDIDQFDKNETFGPYISDQSVTDKILEISNNKTDKPLFLFAITMENHGPLHLEKVTSKETNNYYENNNLDKISASDIDRINDLTVYLRHLKNADKMIQRLAQAYTSETRETLLCFYGDHVPSMPKVYESMQYNDDSSDYFIWSSSKKKDGGKSDMEIESLAIQLLKNI